MRRRTRVALSVLVATVGLLVAAAPGAAKTVPGSPPFRVLIMEHLSPAQFRHLAARGAAGLLVPGVGPTTNRRQALAELERGAEVNARLGGVPRGPTLISTHIATGMPSGSRIIVVALPPRGGLVANDRRYPIVVIGGGFQGGELLTSPTTRIPGLVAIQDIAPTALGHELGSLSSVPAHDVFASLRSLDRQIHSNNRLKLAVLIVIACWITLLALVWPRAAVSAVPASLLTSIVVGAAQVTNEVAIMTFVVIGTVAGGMWLARVCRTDERLLLLIALVLALHLWVFAVRPEWAAVSPLGPTQNSRFWGIGNQMETLLLAPMLAGAAIAARRFGIVGFGAFGAFALLLMTANAFGSDGGGAIVLGVALAVLGARTLRLGVRGFVTTLLLAATSVLLVVRHDLAQQGPYHLRSAFTHGMGGLVAVAENRFPLAYKPAIDNWTMVLPLAVWFVATLAFFVWRQRRPGARDLVLALSIAIGTSLVVNDSAAYELSAGVAALAAVARFVPDVAPFRLRVLAAAPQPAAGEAAGSE